MSSSTHPSLVPLGLMTVIMAFTGLTYMYERGFSNSTVSIKSIQPVLICSILAFGAYIKNGSIWSFLTGFGILQIILSTLVPLGYALQSAQSGKMSMECFGWLLIVVLGDPVISRLGIEELGPKLRAVQAGLNLSLRLVLLVSMPLSGFLRPVLFHIAHLLSLYETTDLSKSVVFVPRLLWDHKAVLCQGHQYEPHQLPCKQEPDSTTSVAHEFSEMWESRRLPSMKFTCLFVLVRPVLYVLSAWFAVKGSGDELLNIVFVNMMALLVILDLIYYFAVVNIDDWGMMLNAITSSEFFFAVGKLEKVQVDLGEVTGSEDMRMLIGKSLE